MKIHKHTDSMHADLSREQYLYNPKVHSLRDTIIYVVMNADASSSSTHGELYHINTYPYNFIRSCRHLCVAR